MNQLTRNRLIGGTILLFAGLLFIPVLLSPPVNNLSNPNLTVKIDSKTPEQEADLDRDNRLPTVDNGVVLESIADTKPQISNEQPKKQPKNQPTGLLPVSLASIGGNDKEETQSSPSSRQDNQKNQRWLRVGSFSRMENAKELVKKLETNRYPVKIKTTKISEKTYHRVLVGPLSNESIVQATMKKMIESGYKPSIQR